MSKTKIVFVGGGTGGHFYPLIAIAEAVRAEDPEAALYYAGPERYDAESLASANLAYVYVPAGKKRKYRSILNYFDAIKIAIGFIVAVIRLYIIYPDVVISKGGYTSVPVVLAAAFLRIPVVVHESDAKIGTANKLAAKFAREVVVAYSEAAALLAHHPRVHILGIPIRQTLQNPPSPHAIESLGIDPVRPVLLVLGGSQGAERVNQLILDSLDELLATYTIIHQTGKSSFENVQQSAARLIPDSERSAHYHPVPFLNAEKLNDAYHLAQIVISRAGSTSIYEIALHGKPSIIIPIPEEISHDQRTNAYAYARSGAAVVIEEKNMSDALLRAEIDRIMQDDALYGQMAQAAYAFGKSDTAQQICALTTQIAKEH